MPRGRRPIPEKLHQLNGNPGKRPRRDVIEIVFGPLGEAPEHWQPEAKAIWAEITTEMPFEVATAADRIATEMLVRLVAQVRSDPEKLTPARAAQIRSYCNEFGMTPSARARLAIGSPKPATKSKFEGLIGLNSWKGT